MIVVAEVGSNHKGVESLAYEYIRQAALCGCDIVKFQLGHDKDDPVRGKPNEWMEDLVHCADEYGITFLASCFSLESLERLEPYSDRVKIASQYAFSHHSNEDYDAFIGYAKELFRYVYVSDMKPREGIFRIYCQAKYPTMPWEVEMPDAFGFDAAYGYSSHTPGIEDGLIAASRGAMYIEKHFTLDKTEESIKDNHFALTPDEMAALVTLSKGIERILG